MSILEDYIITKRFLFPRKKDLKNPYFIHTQGNKLSCFRSSRFQNSKMLFVFHAGNELVEDYAGSFAREIEKMGINLFLVEYPGYSMSNGKPNIINILDTIPGLIKSCGTPTHDLIVFGRSIGAAYALETVVKYPQIKGLIIDSGAADFYERISKRVNAEDLDCSEDELKGEVLKYFDTEKKLKEYKGSTLIMHAKDDRIVETEQALKNYDWANEPKKIQMFDLSTHKGIQYSNKTEYFNTILDFINGL